MADSQLEVKLYSEYHRWGDYSNAVVDPLNDFDLWTIQEYGLYNPVPYELSGRRLNQEQRRHLFLIFKEAVNNIARHSDCKSASLNLTVSHNVLSAQSVTMDWGLLTRLLSRPRRMDLGGRGLENIQKRAAQVKGHLIV